MGISTGANIFFHVAIKPVATIAQAQHTASYDGTDTVLEAKGRHDPCVLPRAPTLVEGMTSLVQSLVLCMRQSLLQEIKGVHEAILAARNKVAENGAKKARFQRFLSIAVARARYDFMSCKQPALARY